MQMLLEWSVLDVSKEWQRDNAAGAECERRNMRGNELARELMWNHTDHAKKVRF